MQALGCLGNILWFFPFGLGTGLLWCIAGVLCFISIIGIPWGLQCFKFAKLTFWPFGKEIQYGGGAMLRHGRFRLHALRPHAGLP